MITVLLPPGKFTLCIEYLILTTTSDLTSKKASIIAKIHTTIRNVRYLSTISTSSLTVRKRDQNQIHAGDITEMIVVMTDEMGTVYEYSC